MSVQPRPKKRLLRRFWGWFIDEDLIGFGPTPALVTVAGALLFVLVVAVEALL